MFLGSGFRVRGWWFSWFGVSGAGFRDSGFRSPGFRVRGYGLRAGFGVPRFQVSD